MLVDVDRLAWLAGSSDIILKVDHPRTIPLKFDPNRPSSFREEDFSNIFPMGSYVKTMSADVGCAN